MKVAVMQPYFMPYIGYFQLVRAVDKFIVYDDVAFIKRGWINRNRILLGGKAFLLTVPVRAASQFKLINQTSIADGKEKIWKTLTHAYGKAAFFRLTSHLLEEILYYEENNLARFVTHSLILTCKHLGIDTEFSISSAIPKNSELRGEEKVLDICRAVNASTYINAIGGTELYSKNQFKQQGIELKFLKTLEIQYQQFGNPFISWLSIIDVMMFNSQDAIRSMLSKYELV